MFRRDLPCPACQSVQFGGGGGGEHILSDVGAIRACVVEAPSSKRLFLLQEHSAFSCQVKRS